MGFDALYEQYKDRVFQWAMRYAGGDAAAAEDMVQEVFLKMHARLATLHEHEDLGGWLFRVTANIALSQRRGARARASLLSRLFSGHDEPVVPSPAETFERTELAEEGLEDLKKLTPKERVVVSLKLIDGLSQREIAGALELSEGYVSKLWARAAERLRAMGWKVLDD